MAKPLTGPFGSSCTWPVASSVVVGSVTTAGAVARTADKSFRWDPYGARQKAR
jgi:hypothetical protein